MKIRGGGTITKDADQVVHEKRFQRWLRGG
jgi:hypothetical protein